MKWIQTPLLALLLAGALAVSSYGAADMFTVKTGAEPRRQLECAVAIPEGAAFNFTAADLERRLSLTEDSLRGITVTALPDQADGMLMLGGVEVESYQFISRAELNELCFVPGEAAVAASLTLLPQGVDSRPTQLSINVLSSVNETPTAEGMSLATVRNMALYSSVAVNDPEGDAISILVVTAPEKGEVVFTGNSFVYTPFRNKTGSDRFVYCAVDRFGNYSPEAVVDIKIESNRSGFYFVDMAGNPAAYAAVKLQGKGVLSGRQIGGGWFFEPNRTATRGELLVMVMAAAGMDQSLTPTANTGLEGDASLPLWLKPYVRKAVEEGMWARTEAFTADQIPTRAEAVQMVALAAKISDVRDYPLRINDIAAIPDWALQSYKELAAYRMLDLYDGSAYPDRALDNAYAATLLWQLYQHTHR